MFNNYMKIAWRSLSRRKLFSLINIVGLAIGLSASMLIMIYVAHEFSYNRFHKNSKKIVLLTRRDFIGVSVIQLDHFTYVTGEIVERNASGVAGCMRLRKPNTVIIDNPKLSGAKFSESNVLFADPNFFSFFSFKLISGNAVSVLAKPYSLVISRNMALKYFGNQNPLGKILKIKSDSLSYPYKITGIVENSPSNSSIVFDFVASNSSLINQPDLLSGFKEEKIDLGDFQTFLQLKTPSDTSKLKLYLTSYAKSHKGRATERFILTPIEDLHLTYDYTSASKYLIMFVMAACLILLLALVNYISLSTAQSSIRAKEIGIRKVAGASRKAIAVQFYIESALFSIIAFSIAVLVSRLLKPAVFSGLEINMDSSFFYSDSAIMILIILLTVTIALTGTYPALILSSYQPAIIITGMVHKTWGALLIRKLFTVIQFSVATGMIVCGIIIDAQMHFFRHADTGIHRDSVIIIPVNKDFGSRYLQFKNDISSLASISQVATSTYELNGGYDIAFYQDKKSSESMMISTALIDRNFMSVLGIHYKIPPVNIADSILINKVILNETAVQKLKLGKHPLGQLIDWGPKAKTEIIGVVKDFNFVPMKYEIEPFALFIQPDSSSLLNRSKFLYAKIKAHTNLPSLIEAMKESYKKYKQMAPFEYSFMDENFDRQFKAENRLSAIFNSFMLTAVILAILGLFGLATFTIEQRTKEIGIRKVLGASSLTISTLLSKELLKLISLSVIIACPVAWWTMREWLNNFAYRTEIKWWMFASAGLMVIFIASFTISYHTIRAALANPVKALRTQ